MDAILSVFAWSEIAVIVIGGFFIQAPLFVFTSPFDPGRKIAGRFLRLMAVAVAKLSPFWDFHVVGDLPKPLPKKLVVVSNHVSNADVFLISHLPWEMKWLAKEELFKVPFVGWELRIAGDVPVRRGERGSGYEALQKCAEWIERGVPVSIFPEGTRSKTGELGQFKDGAFKLAIESGADILPLAVAGTLKALPKHSWKFSRSKGVVKVGQIISTQGMTLDDLERLKSSTREQIARMQAEIAPLTEQG